MKEARKKQQPQQVGTDKTLSAKYCETTFHNSIRGGGQIENILKQKWLLFLLMSVKNQK